LEKAYKFVKKALDLDSTHIEALETMATVQMEMGNSESAKTIYEKLVKLNPNEGFSKYMCLGQLSCGIEAVNFYKKGIELMINQFNKEQSDTKPCTSSSAMKNNDTDEDEEDLQKVSKTEISTAYGSIAEIYLTDLWLI
jgi:tetratricopeptide (TPR) repeat protein